MKYVVQPFEAQVHAGMLSEALKERGSGLLGLDVLPNCGFVCLDEAGSFVCALFLQRTDCSVCRLENFVVRAGLHLEDYAHPMNLVRTACEACAKELGYTYILVTTYPHLCRYIEQNAGYLSYAKRFSASYKIL